MANKKIEYSSYQKEIFKNIAKEQGHLIVEARAGVGKSTTLIESLRFVPSSKKVIVLAFNKIIATELEEKIHRTNVEIRTFHSLGLKAITARFGKPIINQYKVMDILKYLEDFDLAAQIAKTVSLVKATLKDSPKDIEKIIVEYGIDLCEMDLKQFITIVIKTLSECKNNTAVVDFDDMCYFAFVHNLNVGAADMVYTDEAQDLNACQIFMAKKAVKQNGRLIFFQDRFQRLYGFRAADSTQIMDLEKLPTTKTLPLPISYRCPQTVIEFARRLVPDIEYNPGANVGSITETTSDLLIDSVKSGDAVLSRTNAPIIKIAMKLLKLKKRFTILGKDIGEDLLYTIKKSKKKSINDFIKWLDSWKEENLAYLKSKGMSPENFMDKFECLFELANDSKTIVDLQNKIKDMFDASDVGKIITLATCHAAKGKEWDNVYALKWTLSCFPNPGDVIVPNHLDQDLCITYVCATRARKNLIFVNKSK